MVRRALLLAFALALVALPARAGIVPSFASNNVTVFQQGVLPDTNFSGHQLTQIQHRTATVIGDTLNFGGADPQTLGFQTARTNRFVEIWNLGSYLPTSAIIDSMKECWYASGAGVADTLVRSLLLVPWVLGAGDGTFSDAVDTTGVCWRSPNYPTISTWNKRGADSSFTATGNVTWHSAREQALLGKLNYGGAQDKEGAWHYSGLVQPTATNWDTTDVSMFRFIYNDVRAAANYGWITRVLNEGTGRMVINGPLAGEAALRPKLLVYWHDTRSVIQIGGGE